ncbi:HEXXH motif domain-containing protein [Streptomyces sp. NBC_00076]|uniref:HEXXH motif domain-containing protein n=1 Tax=Streptomyces sp. NBC_00076 TaxID=2975642 RepID=UPI00324C5BEF
MPPSPSDADVMLVRHHTPASDLDELAKGHMPPATARRIRAVERGRRMLMVRAVVEAARETQADTASPLSPLETALDLLMRCERIRPDVVADLLDHPGLGVWAVRTLERLSPKDQPGGDAREDGPPLWRELGYLHALAASAALRAAVPSTIDLPVLADGVPLPTLGRVTLPGPMGHTAGPTHHDVAVLLIPSIDDGPPLLTVAGLQFALPADLSAKSGVWQPLRRVAGDTDAPDRALILDDSDPYRDFRTHPQPSPAPLAQGEADRWELMLREADESLVRRHPRAAELRATALRVLVPLPIAPRYRPMSASYNEAFGSALMSLHEQAPDLAATLVHEARHSALNGLMHQLPLCEDPLTSGEPRLLYAPWRGDPRPPAGLLHGAYAFAGVADFWRVERHALTGAAADLAHFEFALWRAALTEALESLRSCPELTAPGRRFVAAMATDVDAWASESVPTGPDVLAREEASDLRAVWRARHTRPDADRVRGLAREWLRRTDPETLPGIRSALRPDPRFSAPDPRGELRRALLDGADAVVAHARGESYAASRRPALAAADLALISGDSVRAADGYRGVLTENPESPSAWVGLGFAFAASDEPTAGHALLQRPEVVRAVYLTLLGQDGDEAPDALAVSDWIGRMPTLRGGRTSHREP